MTSSSNNAFTRFISYSQPLKKANDISQVRAVIHLHAPQDPGNLTWQVVDNGLLEQIWVVVDFEGYCDVITQALVDRLLGELDGQT
jgi:hypothetical protein